jgi:DNA mismatch repair protein MutS
MATIEEHSPIRTQYLTIKRQYPDALIFFRLGDFYETFDTDAEVVARELELTLTKREWGRGERSPMAGVPYHAADTYIARMVGRGFRVAVVEQITEPTGKGLVERQVMRIITPGTVVDPAMLAARANNYLAAVIVGQGAVGLAYADITTGEFCCTQCATGDAETTLAQELSRIGAAEVLVEAPERARLNPRALRISDDGDETSDDGAGLPEWVARIAPFAGHITPLAARDFAERGARERLLAHFQVTTLEGFGCDRLPLAVRAAGAVLAYLHLTQRDAVEQVVSLSTYAIDRFMILDAYTRRNLELFESGRDRTTRGSLIWVLDQTQTPMGSRLLRRWLGQPLLDLAALQRRHDAVALLLRQPMERARLGASLKRAGDLERLANRVLQRIATPRDLVALAAGLRAVEALIAENGPIPSLHGNPPPREPSSTGTLREPSSPSADGAGSERGRDASRPYNDPVHAGGLRGGTPLGANSFARVPDVRVPDAVSTARPADLITTLLGQPVDACTDVAAIIEAAIVETPPILITDGGIIQPGYASELDDIHDKSKGARDWIAALEGVERKRTGISTLKVGFNKVFGYFIEVTAANVAKVPSDYIRKQTIANGERYITPALKEYESLVLNAQDRSTKLEYDLFVKLRGDLATFHADRIVETARAIATLDVLVALAEVAERNNYTRPTLDDGTRIHIIAGRHPVIEQTQRDHPFVPNDLDLDSANTQIMLITGPNMAGKSTIMRQTALIVLLAQIGSFVPAEAAHIGLVDRIFTRIGAQDDLATGQSTFMVEMIETANILRHATPRSLVVLDEIGRGTSTYDGLAIARAIVEYLHQHPRCGAKTLFATHYHELVEVARQLPHVQPYSIAVTEEDGHVVFLRTLVPGGADRSYGVHVAQLAGIPRQVIRRAEEILLDLEQHGDGAKRKRAMREPVPQRDPATLQMTLFTPSAAPDPIVDELRDLPVEEMTPLEAMQMLYRLRSALRERETNGAGG